jgi:hypothetical protein
LGKCSHENPIRLLLICRETVINANQREFPRNPNWRKP